jgi:hypothetical protein
LATGIVATQCKQLQCWAFKMSVLSYRMENLMGELNYWKYLMMRWGIGG